MVVFHMSTFILLLHLAGGCDCQRWESNKEGETGRFRKKTVRGTVFADGATSRRRGERSGSDAEIPITCSTSSQVTYRLRRFFMLCRKSPRAHYTAPPFRKKSRSAHLFSCKRLHDGLLSLPTFCGNQTLSFMY